MFTYVYHFSWKNPLNIPHLQYAPRHIQRHISTALRQTLAAVDGGAEGDHVEGAAHGAEELQG